MILDLIMKYWDILVFAIIILLPLVPPKWVGLNTTFIEQNSGRETPAKKMSVLNALINLVIPLIISLLSLWGLKGTVSLVIFSVIAVDLIYRKQVSREAVILVGIGIIALYLDQLIEKGKRISFLKFMEWERKD